MVTFDSVFFAYKDQQILNNFNLKITPNKTTVLIGPSGCGKSTILRLVNRLLIPSSGTISVDNEIISEKNIQAVRYKTGYVIQDGGLFPNMTAEQNITLMARRLKWKKSALNKRLQELLELTHFSPDFLKRYPAQLSGGQQQRVSLMRALMLDPKLLLLDEPFAALDPLIRADLHESMIGIFKKLQKTVLMVTHDLHEAAYLGNQIILLSKGEIIQSGQIKELISKPANTFVTQFIKAQRSHLPELDE